MESGANPVRLTYDRVAPTYAARIADELRGKPLDRLLLARLAADAGPRGNLCDVGCGPGHVAQFLADVGATVIALDLSSAMLGEAGRIAPRAPGVAADMRQLPFSDGALSGICALYSIIHVPPPDRAGLLGEFRRARAR